MEQAFRGTEQNVQFILFIYLFETFISYLSSL